MNEDLVVEPGIYCVRYDYPDGSYNITEILVASKEDAELKLYIYAWQEKYEWKFVTEQDYINYFHEQVSTWTVSKKKRK